LGRVFLLEQCWLQFFKDNNITYEPLAYEDFVNDYDYNIDYLLTKFGVPAEKRSIPEKPLKKISNQKNEEFRNTFIDLICGNEDAGSII